nr:hypothetical protein [Tanacetum cinerariifolium]
MVAILEKLDAAEGFEQIIDFLSGSYINHALTMNPHVYISCIKQFWNTAMVKRSGDVTRVGKGFSRVKTPLFESMLAIRDVAEDAEAQVPTQGDDVQEPAAEEVATDVVSPIPTSPSPSSPQVLDTCSAFVLRVEGLENDKATQLEIVKLKARVKKLEKINKVKSFKLRRLKKVGTSQRVESLDDVENVFNQGRNIVDMDQDEGIELPKTLTITAALAVSTRKRKGVVIRDPEEELPSDTPAETPKVKDKGKEILIEPPKPMKKKDQIEMDAEEEMEKEDEEIIKSINKALAQKATKRRKPSEEAQEADDLRKRLEITMFEEPDGQDAIWRNQKSVHGLALVKRWKLLTSCGVHVIILSTVQLFLLVKRRYPLSRFTLEQLVNVTRLQVEKESEMSLELLRFTRQQLQEYQHG